MKPSIAWLVAERWQILETRLYLKTKFLEEDKDLSQGIQIPGCQDVLSPGIQYLRQVEDSFQGIYNSGYEEDVSDVSGQEFWKIKCPQGTRGDRRYKWG